jgi:hypothetical protein
LRTGPLVRRGAKFSRVAKSTSSALRSPASATLFSQSLPGPPLLPGTGSVFRSSCRHLECHLPINLREFLAGQLGAPVDTLDETVLNLAASADAATLSKLARAIRRYSTTRAQQAWQECSLPLARFGSDEIAPKRTEAALCLRCARVEFGPRPIARHPAPACLTIVLGRATAASAERISSGDEARAANRIRRLIEEFRGLRTGFGLPHFDLDSYVANGQVTFTWRPIS